MGYRLWRHVASNIIIALQVFIKAITASINGTVNFPSVNLYIVTFPFQVTMVT